MVKCSFCKSTDTYIKSHHHVFQIKDQEITIDSDCRFCTNCHQLVYDELLDQEATSKALVEYNKCFGIVGEDIISLRH